MSTDTEIRVSGVRILSDGLGEVEAERFIEPFVQPNVKSAPISHDHGALNIASGFNPTNR